MILPVVKPVAEIENIIGINSLMIQAKNGTPYYDLFNDDGVLSLGYKPDPSIFQRYSPHHVPLMYDFRSRNELIETLCLKYGFPYLFPAGGGSEANELAIKIIRKHMNVNRRSAECKIYCARGGFHGRTLGSLSATDTHHRKGFEPLLNYIKFFDDPKEIDGDCGGIFLATVFGHHDVQSYDSNFWELLQYKKEFYDVLLALDEIKCGSGRWGNKFFAYQSTPHVVPDIVTLGKGVAGGVPVAFTLMCDKAAELMKLGEHFSTFSSRICDLRSASLAYDRIVAEIPRIREQCVVMTQAVFPFQVRGENNWIAIVTGGQDKRLISNLKINGILPVPISDGKCVKLTWNFNISDEEFKDILYRVAKSVKETLML